MRTALADRRVGLAIPAVLVLLLGFLAALQWRWIGAVSDLERRRLEERLHVAGAGFAHDFDREIAHLFLAFHPESGESIAEHAARVPLQVAAWRAEAEWPDLLAALWLVRRDPAGGGTALARFDPRSGAFEEAPWPEELRPLAERLAEEGSRAAGRGGFPGFLHSTLPGVPAVVLPFVFAAEPDGAADRRPRPAALLVLVLDRRALRDSVLPDLARRHFGEGSASDCDLAVLDPRDPGEPIFVAGAGDARGRALDPRSADLVVPLFGFRPFDEMRSLADEGEPPAFRRQAPRPRHFEPDRGPGEREPGGEWLLVARRRDGSLEAAVDRARRHNLAVSGAILLLLAAAVGFVLLSAERARRLARQQLEFVAGVTHELHTPLAAIRAAGENLADGLVREPAQVARYGAMIRAEGRRLSSMVEQMLELAGIRSGRRDAPTEPVDVEAAIAGAVEETRWLAEERGVTVAVSGGAGRPLALADRAGLQRAIRNLIENAVKHGGEGGWVGVSATRTVRGEIEIAVEDRGPGVADADLPRLFEPFFRGRAAAAGTPGSGLGLALVRQIAELHGGRVRVERPAGGRGARFVLALVSPPSPSVAIAENPA
jgi:signal transduction histidine kinase